MTRATPTWFEHKTPDTWQCTLCPHQCVLREGATGRCRVRAVQNNKPIDLSYGKISARQLDPIEKKPLYHYLPGSLVYSIGGYGCNFRCAFCQNWHIAQCRPQNAVPTRPEDIVAEAQQCGAIGIAYTYNEPIISYAFVHETALRAREAGLYNILITNGYIQPAPAASLLRVIDAINLDIKCIDNVFYRHHCGGRVEPVLAFAQQAFAAQVHIEITNLLISRLNDDPKLSEQLAQWIAQNLSPDTVLHISAYHPAYEMHLPATPAAIVRNARELAQKYLRYVYCGNIPDTGNTQNTLCAKCGHTLITRHNRHTCIVGLTEEGRCQHCASESTIRLPRG